MTFPIRPRATLLILGLAFVLTAVSVFMRGALDSGVGSLNDEPAHYATSMMVCDYLLGGNWFSPIDYARDWYLHYPKVALGQWPPVLYGLLGTWMVLFGVSTGSAILGMAFLTACCATVLMRWLLTMYGWIAAISGGLVFIMLPLVQQFSGCVMTEIPLALFCTLAVLAYGRFLDEGRTQDALAFGLFAVAGILTKGNALALAFVPLLALVLTRRFELLRQRSYWLPAVLVLLLCAPWYLITADIQVRSWSGGTHPNWAYSLQALPAYLGAFVKLGGWGLILFAGSGLVVGCRRERGMNGVWIATACFLGGLLFLLVVLPSDVDGRHLVLGAPLLVGCAVSGAVWISARLGVASAYALALLPLLIFAASEGPVPKDFGGYGAPVAGLLQDPANERAVLLVAGDAIGEGLVIGGGAAVDGPRPRHHILRASKVLITDDWNGRDYQFHFPSLDQLQAQLEAFPVAFLILDSSTNPAQWFEHHTLLEELVLKRKDAWELYGSHDVRRGGELFPDALRFYRLKDWRSMPACEIQFYPLERDRFLQNEEESKPLIGWVRR